MIFTGWLAECGGARGPSTVQYVKGGGWGARGGSEQIGSRTLGDNSEGQAIGTGHAGACHGYPDWTGMHSTYSGLSYLGRAIMTHVHIAVLSWKTSFRKACSIFGSKDEPDTPLKIWYQKEKWRISGLKINRVLFLCWSCDLVVYFRAL